MPECGGAFENRDDAQLKPPVIIEPSVYLTNSCPQSLSSGAARIILVLSLRSCAPLTCPSLSLLCGTPELQPKNILLSRYELVLASLELYTIDQVVLGVHGELAARHLWIKIARGRLDLSSDPF